MSLVPVATLVSVVLYALGFLVFRRFEEGSAAWRRIVKAAIYVGLSALVATSGSVRWTVVWVAFWPLLGLMFHVWFCRKHGIGVLSAEPRDKYYQLRGWGPPPAR